MVRGRVQSRGNTEGVIAANEATAQEETSVDILERLETIETLLEILILHAQLVTGEELVVEDLEKTIVED